MTNSNPQVGSGNYNNNYNNNFNNFNESKLLIRAKQS